MNPLTKQTIQIDIDPETGTYSIDFVGCKLGDAFKVLNNIVVTMENGSMFNGELGITDEHGNALTREQIRDVIARAKAEIDSGSASRSKNPLH